MILDEIIYKLNCNKQYKLLITVFAIALFVIVLIFFKDVQYADFLHWDDDGYIEKNPLIRSIGMVEIGKMLTSFYFANWHPLTWFSHAVDIQLFGYSPKGPHIINLMIHGLNTILLYILILTISQIHFSNISPDKQKRLSKSDLLIAFIISLLFALHPLRIESFAWVSERKDVLCSFFFLLSLILYINRNNYPKFSKKLYLASLVAFVMAILSKGMAVTLPIILLIMDFIPGFRSNIKDANLSQNDTTKDVRNILVEKIPFLFFSIVGGMLVLFAQHEAGAVKTITTLSISVRILNAVNSIFVYISKTIFPIQLLPIYPYPEHVHSLNIISFTQICALVLFLIFCVYKYRRGSVYYLSVSLIYGALMLPVLGLLQVGEQPFADRYSYLSTIPFYIVAALLLMNLAIQKNKNKKIFLAKFLISYSALVGVMFLAIVCSMSYIGVWKNDVTFWEYVINNSNKPAVIAYNNLGLRYVDEKQYKKAETILIMGIEKYPNNGALYNNLRILYDTTHQNDNAIRMINNLIMLNGSSETYISDKSHFYIRQGNYLESLNVLQQGMSTNPHSAQLKYQAAYCYAKLQQYPESLSLLNEILDHNPSDKRAADLQKEILALANRS